MYAIRSYYDREYLRLAESDIGTGSFAEALSYADLALRINKDDGDATRLREVARKGIAESGENVPVAAGESSGTAMESYNPENLTVRSALSRSKSALSAGDWYTAHYYAMLAWRLAPGTDPLKQDALRQASEAWNQITEGTAAANPAEAELFDIKRTGYESIENGDFLNAYYVLHDLRERESAANRNNFV